jgi:hypothetical protein
MGCGRGYDRRMVKLVNLATTILPPQGSEGRLEKILRSLVDRLRQKDTIQISRSVIGLPQCDDGGFPALLVL